MNEEYSNEIYSDLIMQFGLPQGEAVQLSNNLARLPDAQKPKGVVVVPEYSDDGQRVGDGKAFLFLDTLLGSGSYGSVFTAKTQQELESGKAATWAVKRMTLGNSSNALSSFNRDPRQPPQSLGFQETNYFVESTEREFMMAKLIERRLDESVCVNQFVCIAHRIYTRDRNYAYLVSDLPSRDNLGMLMYRTLYGSIRTLLLDVVRFARNANVDVALLDDLLPVINNDNLLYESRLIALDLYKRGTELRALCLLLSLQLMTAVALLHSVNLFHSDIKPQNIVVERTDTSYRARLIDFGIGCAEPENNINNNQQRFTPNEQYYVECDNRYRTTASVMDPLAYNMRTRALRPGDQDVEYIRATGKIFIDEKRSAEMFAKFDGYALAKNIMVIFGEQRPDPSGGLFNFVVVEEMFLMPQALLDVVQVLTGEDNYETELGRATLRPNEIGVRYRQFNTRMTVAQTLEIVRNAAQTLQQRSAPTLT